MGEEWDSFGSGAGVEKDRKSAGGFGKDSPTNENAFAAAQVRFGKMNKPQAIPAAWDPKHWTARPAKDKLRAEGSNRATDGTLPLYTGGHAYQEYTRRWAVEVFRVLKPGGYLLSFGGTRTYHRMTCGIEDAGFEIRDQIDWIYGSGFPKYTNVQRAIDMKQCRASGREGRHYETKLPKEADRRPGDHICPVTPEGLLWEGWSTALKPAHEPICVARKPFKGTIANQVMKHGTGAMNTRSCEIGRDADDVPGWHKSGADGSKGYRGKGTFKIRADSAEEIQARMEGRGRWPSNVIFTPTLDDDCPVILLDSQAKGASRFFYCPKPSKAERDLGLDSFTEKLWVQWQTANGTSKKPSSISEGRKTMKKNDHPTIKPVGLCRYLCRLVTPPGGTVLDLFLGSGSIGVAAIAEGFKFIGIEKHPPYFEIARARLDYALWAWELARDSHENVEREIARMRNARLHTQKKRKAPVTIPRKGARKAVR